jgi:excisionase family DNA binding protein
MSPKRPPGFSPPEETVAVFARVPASAGRKLSRTAVELGRPKQEVLATLVDRYADLLGEDISVGRASSSAEPREVLSAQELAEFLQVELDAVVSLAESGGLPGRQIAGEWRFARSAILSWLASSQ